VTYPEDLVGQAVPPARGRAKLAASRWRGTPARAGGTACPTAGYATVFAKSCTKRATGRHANETPRSLVDQIDVADVPAGRIELLPVSSVHPVVEYPRHIVPVCDPEDQRLFLSQRQCHTS